MALACAYCGGHAQGNHTIHRDGLGKGPEVPLCDEHGSRLKPTCSEIWARISVFAPVLPAWVSGEETP